MVAIPPAHPPPLATVPLAATTAAADSLVNHPMGGHTVYSKCPIVRCPINVSSWRLRESICHETVAPLPLSSSRRNELHRAWSRRLAHIPHLLPIVNTLTLRFSRPMVRKPPLELGRHSLSLTCCHIKTLESAIYQLPVTF